MIKEKRGVIFFEVNPSEVDDWQIVTAVNVVTFDDTVPWPELVDPRERSRRESRDGASIVADGALPGGSVGENALLNGMTVPPPLFAAPKAGEGPRPIAAPEGSKAMASATPPPVGPKASVGDGSASISGQSRSTPTRATASAKSPPSSKAAATKNSMPAKDASTARRVVVMDSRHYGGAKPYVAKRPTQ